MTLCVDCTMMTLYVFSGQPDNETNIFNYPNHPSPIVVTENCLVLNMSADFANLSSHQIEDVSCCNDLETTGLTWTVCERRKDIQKLIFFIYGAMFCTEGRGGSYKKEELQRREGDQNFVSWEVICRLGVALEQNKLS